MFNSDNEGSNSFSSDQFMESENNILYFTDKHFYSPGEDSKFKNVFIGNKRKYSYESNSQEEDSDFKKRYCLKSTKENSPNIMENEKKIINIQKKPIFKVVYDLSTDEILKKYKDKIPNNHIIDYYFQHFKREFAHYYTNLLNDSIKKCEFKNKIKNFSIPNNESFQAKSNYTINKEYLNYKMEEIFTNIKYKKKFKGGRQIGNRDTIININNFECKNQNEYNILLNLLANKLEMAYKLFYDDKKSFFKFEKNESTRYYDYFFKKMYGYSLIENYGIIKFIKNEK